MAEVKIYGNRPEGKVGRLPEVAPKLGTLNTADYLALKGNDIGGLESYHGGRNIVAETLGVSAESVSIMSGLDVIVAVRRDVMNNESEQDPV